MKPARETQAETRTIDNARAILSKELDRLLSTGVPQYGTLSLTAHLMDGDVSRVEVGASVSRRIAPRSNRGGVE